MAQYFDVTVASHNPPKDSQLSTQVVFLDGCELYDRVNMYITVSNGDGTSTTFIKTFFAEGDHFVKGGVISFDIYGVDVGNRTIYKLYGYGRLADTQQYDYSKTVFLSSDVNSTDKKIVWGDGNTTIPTPTNPKFTELKADASLKIVSSTITNLTVIVNTVVTITAKLDNDMTKVRLYKNNVSSTTVVGVINPYAGQREVTFTVSESTPQTVKYIAQGEY